MDLKKDSSYLLIKINTPENINFLKEHSNILEKNGYVWFCRFGKSNVLPEKICSCNNYIFLKDSKKNNDKIYIAKYEKISSSPQSSLFPKYYSEISLEHSLWFKLVQLQEFDYNFLINNFVTKSTNSELKNVFRSMCSSFYITCNKDLNIKTGKI